MRKLKRLYVLRHGNAQPYGYAHDESRELTEHWGGRGKNGGTSVP